ncbi:sporulation integral membrane protein YtvI [Thiorhodovibrio winogradskyi]|uniref:Sporulation integral membrane protein YtvI n=1 Tax=Thiorhodovibrio winogradskyi TaxID=77007 RepID=A0ABZ0S918_9GAMM|nr:AI-2E family transporter [Thiorhodovibrio winogradskyi]
MHAIGHWFRRHFSDPQILFLAFSLLSVLVIVITLGNMLTPVFASIVIAYLLEGAVGFLERKGWPRLLGSLVALLGFMLFLASLLLLVLPLLWRQATDLVQQLPGMLTTWQQALMGLPQRYPELVTNEQIHTLINTIRAEILYFGQKLVSLSMSSVVGMITVIVYLILMPLLVFFFLKDKELILDWFKGYLPRHRRIAGSVWQEVDRQIYNYVRGKVWEILIIWAVSFAAFSAFGLNYALLLAVLVGLSVIVPYIGASVVTIPVVLIAWFQWGWSPQLLWLSVVYLIIQAADGNVLVPLLFSEVVNLHPVAIIVAILVFGGIWGFWGVFFAIPLATLVQAVLCAWPQEKLREVAKARPSA